LFTYFQSLISQIKSCKDPVEAQEEILKATVLHPYNIHQPIKEEYQRNFLKRFISEVIIFLKQYLYRKATLLP
jgi:hypothetical protein